MTDAAGRRDRRAIGDPRRDVRPDPRRPSRGRRGGPRGARARADPVRAGRAAAAQARAADQPGRATALAMVELAIAGEAGTSAEPDRDRPRGPSYTVDTLEALRRRAPARPGASPGPHVHPVGRDVRRAARLARAGAAPRARPDGGRCRGPGTAPPTSRRWLPGVRASGAIGLTLIAARCLGVSARRSGPGSLRADRSGTWSRCGRRLHRRPWPRTPSAPPIDDRPAPPRIPPP